MKIRKQKSRLPALLSSALLIVGASSAVLYFEPFTASPDLKPVTTQRVATPPVEAKPVDEALQDFAPLSEQPTRLVVDKLGIDAEIEPMGLTAAGLMDDPDTNEGVGWYQQSARAGEATYAMLLNGHYGVEYPGVFRNLDQLDPGDTFEVYGDAGAKLRYKVVETLQQKTEEVDMTRALYPYREGVQSLTIITCEGDFDPAIATYDRRTVLYAERIQ